MPKCIFGTRSLLWGVTLFCEIAYGIQIHFYIITVIQTHENFIIHFALFRKLLWLLQLLVLDLRDEDDVADVLSIAVAIAVAVGDGGAVDVGVGM